MTVFAPHLEDQKPKKPTEEELQEQRDKERPRTRPPAPGRKRPSR